MDSLNVPRSPTRPTSSDSGEAKKKKRKRTVVLSSNPEPLADTPMDIVPKSSSDNLSRCGLTDPKEFNQTSCVSTKRVEYSPDGTKCVLKHDYGNIVVDLSPKGGVITVMKVARVHDARQFVEDALLSNQDHERVLMEVHGNSNAYRVARKRAIVAMLRAHPPAYLLRSAKINQSTVVEYLPTKCSIDLAAGVYGYNALHIIPVCDYTLVEYRLTAGQLSKIRTVCKTVLASVLGDSVVICDGGFIPTSGMSEVDSEKSSFTHTGKRNMIIRGVNLLSGPKKSSVSRSQYNVAPNNKVDYTCTCDIKTMYNDASRQDQLAMTKNGTVPLMLKDTSELEHMVHNLTMFYIKRTLETNDVLKTTFPQELID